MSLAEFYERHYARIVGTIAVLGVCVAVFMAGYVRGSPKSARAVLADLSTQAVDVLVSGWEQAVGTEPTPFLQPSRKPGAGVTVNDPAAGPGDLILLTGFFDGNPGLRLVRRDGTVLKDWPAPFSKLLPERVGKPGAPQTDWNIDLHGSYIEPDGSVVFNFEYQGAVKLDRCGKRLWALPERNHHSVQPATAGGYWIAGRQVYNTPYMPEFRPLVNATRSSGWIEDDLVVRAGADGAVISRKSVFAILEENGLEPLLTANGMALGSTAALADNETLHLNSIVELSPDIAPAFPGFEAGDLVLSIRDYNLVVVVDPDDWKVKWHSTGPWIRQHSAQFMADGTIAVFNNNAYVEALIDGEVSDLTAERVSNILAVDPMTGKARVVYGGPGQELWSVVRGALQPMPGGQMMITEHEAGRALQVDAAGRTVWEYINRFDDARVLELTNARAFPASYFTVRDWSCGG